MLVLASQVLFEKRACVGMPDGRKLAGGPLALLVFPRSRNTGESCIATRPDDQS